MLATAEYQVGIVQSNVEREAVFAVRMVVFVEEQAVPPEEELDAFDLTATHFVARSTASAESSASPASSVLEETEASETGTVVGTARLLDKGEGKGKIGRVAVLKGHRGRGVGALIMRAVEKVARERGFTYLALEAQCYAIPFYEKLGYVAQGEIFLDCNIEHRYMSKVLTSPPGPLSETERGRD